MKVETKDGNVIDTDLEFKVYVPGSELDRVKRILCNFEDEHVLYYKSEPVVTYERVLFTIQPRKKDEGVRLRSILGCRWNGLKPKHFFMLSEDGGWTGYPPVSMKDWVTNLEQTNGKWYAVKEKE